MSQSSKEKKYIELLPEPVSLKATEKIIDQMNNSICRINNKNKKGTGFFVKIPYKSQLLNVLITNSHVINEDDILNNNNISIYLNNDKNIKSIELNNKRKIYTNEKYNITIIEIKEKEDKLYNKYLELDDEIINYFKLKRKEKINNLNYSYSNSTIYLLNCPKDNDIVVSYGKLEYLNNIELFYQCNIKENSSGSPILLAGNQKLIGIHNNISKKYKYNKGSLLIYSIKEFSKIKNNLLIINNKGEYLINNYIIGIFDIKNDNQNIRIINSYEQVNRDIKNDNQNIRIINSYEQVNRVKKFNEFGNEIEIKDNCKLKINDKSIPFSYFHRFERKGIYEIKYTFLLNITKTDFMFYGCSSLTSVDLSNFITNNVTNMSHMFYECSSLIKIDLSNLNTNNVTDMNHIFCGCSSLIKIDLSSFNTNNVKDINYMFIVLILIMLKI